MRGARRCLCDRAARIGNGFDPDAAHSEVVALLSRLTDPFVAGAARARHRPFLDATMAAAALVASADGEVSFARRHVLDQVLDSVERLKTFEVHAAVELFDGHVRALHGAPECARGKALSAVSALAGDTEAGELVLRIADAVARADGQVSAEARARLGEIARTLGRAAPAAAERPVLAPEGPGRRPTVIVLGNEKGGTGKSTTAMHLAVALLGTRARVGSLDLDGRQATLSRYVSNREAFAKKHDLKMAMPRHRCVAACEGRDGEAARREETARLGQAFDDLADCGFVVIDTPGHDCHLSRLGHAHADVLITPLNDSFLDIDVLARIDRDRREVLEPSPYARMVQEQTEARLADGRKPIDWIVMRNRLAHVDARSKRDMARLLEELAKRIGFRLAPGFGERVIFRELFPKGLTLLDLRERGAGVALNMSHLAARQEVRALMQAIGLAEPAASARAAAR